MDSHVLDQLTILRGVHGRGIYHGDIKPRNILMEPREGHLWLVDFGLAGRWLKRSGARKTKKFKPLGPIGALAFASRNAHRCLRTACGDDLESWLYTLAYLLRGGELPWYGKDWEEAGLMKEQITGAELFSGYNLPLGRRLRHGPCDRIRWRTRLRCPPASLDSHYGGSWSQPSPY